MPSNVTRASDATHEIELKRLLVGPGAAERLLTALGSVVSDVEQVNHVFDTPDRRLSRARHSFRVREEDGRFILTAKGPSRGVSGSVSTRTEAEADVPAEVARSILTGREGAIVVLRRSATDAAFAALWEGLEQARAGQALVEIGHFHNRRRRVAVTLPRDVKLLVEVDETHFPNGRIDEEVEIEIDRPELAADVEAWIEERAASVGVETTASKSKLSRFYASIDR